MSRKYIVSSLLCTGYVKSLSLSIALNAFILLHHVSEEISESLLVVYAVRTRRQSINILPNLTLITFRMTSRRFGF